MRTRILLCTLVLAVLMPTVSCGFASTTEVTVDEWVSISAGGLESFAIHSDGSLWAWGDNGFGQLGEGTTITRHRPVRIMENVVSVSAGTRAITSDGSLWTWGGSQTDRDSHTPTKIMDDIVSISSGGAMAITSNGTLVGTAGQIRFIELMEDVVYASAGVNHTLAIIGDGSLWTWGGDNRFGQLGDGTTEERHWQDPIKIMDDVVAVSANSHRSMAITSDGTLWTWGANWDGQLGDGTTENRLSPVKIMEDVVAISAGADHSMAIRSDGGLWAWGSNSVGQLGDGTTENRHTPVKIMEDVVAVSASRHVTILGTVDRSHTLAIQSDGSLWAWGANGHAQLGNGTRQSRLYPVMIHDGKLNP